MITKDGENVEYGYVDKPAWEWYDDNSRLWYEERSRFIAHYYNPPRDGVTVSVFANMVWKPDEHKIRAVIGRMFSAIGLTVNIKRVWLNNYSGVIDPVWYADCDAVWYADIEPLEHA